MKRLLHIFILVALALLTIQCNPKASNTPGNCEAGDTVVRYAGLLSIVSHDSYTVATIRNPWDTAQVLRRYIAIPRDSALPESLPQGTLVRTPLLNSLVYASVHLSLLEQMESLDQVGGVCDLSYIKTPNLIRRAQAGSLVDAGNSISPDVEKVMALAPDAILLSPFENAGYGRIGNMGIPIIECADYMESSPLGRAEWIKLFGVLYGKEAEADSIFAIVESRYNSLKELLTYTDYRPTVISELKSGSAWYMPGGKSYLARLFHDAGANYPWSDNDETGSIPLSFETVLSQAGNADIWLIKSFNRKQLSYSGIQEEYAPYAQFKAFKEKNLYGCDTSQGNYYEETPFRPDLLLQELAALFHPQLFPDYTFRYYKPFAP